MSDPAGDLARWQEANQRFLSAAVAVVADDLAKHEAEDMSGVDRGDEARRELTAARQDMPGPPALDTLCGLFGLSDFERSVLLLCAGCELEGEFAKRWSPPTFSLALAALPGAHWSALGPDAPLRRFRLIELGSGSGLTTRPLSIDERVLHFLTGIPQGDERLHGLVTSLGRVSTPTPSQTAVADRVTSLWSRLEVGESAPVVQLVGSDPDARRSVAATVASSLGLGIQVLPAASIPSEASERDGFVRLWQREAALAGAVLLVEEDDLDSRPSGGDALRRLVETLGSPILLSARERIPLTRRASMAFDVGKPTSEEQRDLWVEVLGERIQRLDGALGELVGQFHLGTTALRAAGRQALAEDPEDLRTALWSACRGQARPRLDDLAQRLKPAAGWDDLVLPERELGTLREILLHVRHRARVYDDWGFAEKSARGLGISALFAGASGTGKTLASEVLAGELDLDLYRIDLSSVVSKYIGETEKNLRRVFDAAEDGGAVLLFDEADALFGKRSEVKDSHDRYANLEVSYLLQRMEAYRGLAILTTNRKSALDGAFLRRLRFVVEFPFPEEAEREEIWRRMFPSETPVGPVDWSLLARLPVAGGNIRNIALGAAFRAAENGGAVTMEHLRDAARSEYLKLGRPWNEADVRGWVS